MKTKIVGIVIIVVLALIIGINIYSAPAKQLAQQLDLGQKYLVEQDYEQAVVAFSQAIDIDPMSADAYIGLADAYVGLGDIDKALEILEQGYAMTGDERFQQEIGEKTNEYGAVAFEYREGYQKYDDIGLEVQKIINILVENIKEMDDVDILWEQINMTEFPLVEYSDSRSYFVSTIYDKYKIVFSYAIYNDDKGEYLYVEVRSEKGQGYSLNWCPVRVANAEVEVWVEFAFATCNCINWQWKGKCVYIGKTLEENEVYWQSQETGEMDNSVRVGEWYRYTTVAAFEDVSDDEYYKSYSEYKAGRLKSGNGNGITTLIMNTKSKEDIYW